MVDRVEEQEHDEKVVSKCVKIADMVEDALIKQLGAKKPTAAIINVARQYMKDHGFVAAKRPNANIVPIAEGVEKAQKEREMPFPASESS